MSERITIFIDTDTITEEELLSEDEDGQNGKRI